MIEINATFYRLQKPSTFAGWRDQTPDDFVFAVKAPRYATIRQTLAEAGPAVERFVESGLAELGAKLGPLLWQFAPTKRYERDEIEAFLALLPKEIGGRRARHVLEPRHESFRSAGFVDQLRRHGAAAVFADSDEYPSIADVTSDFVYARLMRSQASIETGYAPSDLDRFAEIAAAWSRGDEPADLPRIAPPLTESTGAGRLRPLHQRREGTRTGGGAGASVAPEEPLAGSPSSESHPRISDDCRATPARAPAP